MTCAFKTKLNLKISNICLHSLSQLQGPKSVAGLSLYWESLDLSDVLLTVVSPRGCLRRSCWPRSITVSPCWFSGSRWSREFCTRCWEPEKMPWISTKMWRYETLGGANTSVHCGKALIGNCLKLNWSSPFLGYFKFIWGFERSLESKVLYK